MPYRIVKAPKVGNVYVVRVYFGLTGKLRHINRPTLADARTTMRAYLNNTTATTVTILKPIEYARKEV